MLTGVTHDGKAQLSQAVQMNDIQMPVIHTWVRSICAENDFADGDASVIDYASETVSATTNGLYRYKCTHTHYKSSLTNFQEISRIKDVR